MYQDFTIDQKTEDLLFRNREHNATARTRKRETDRFEYTEGMTRLAVWEKQGIDEKRALYLREDASPSQIRLELLHRRERGVFMVDTLKWTPGGFDPSHKWLLEELRCESNAVYHWLHDVMSESCGRCVNLQSRDGILHCSAYGREPEFSYPLTCPRFEPVRMSIAQLQRILMEPDREFPAPKDCRGSPLPLEVYAAAVELIVSLAVDAVEAIRDNYDFEPLRRLALTLELLKRREDEAEIERQSAQKSTL